MTWICTVEHFDSIVSGWLLQLLSRYRLVQQLLVWRQEEHQTCQSSKGLYRTAPERFLGNIYRNRLNTRNTKWAQEQHAGPMRLTEDVWVKMRLTGAVQCTVNGRVLLLASVDGDRPTVLRRAWWCNMKLTSGGCLQTTAMQTRNRRWTGGTGRRRVDGCSSNNISLGMTSVCSAQGRI